MQLFLPLLERTRESGVFPDEHVRASGVPPVPLHLKLMAVLRVHALGCSFERVEESFSLPPCLQAFGTRFRNPERRRKI